MAYKVKSKKLKYPKWTKSERDWYELGWYDANVGNRHKSYKLKKR